MVDGGLRIIDMLMGGVVSPVISTVISIIIMGITSVILIELLNIKKPLYIAITATIIATTPTFATTLTYTYCSVAYTIAMLTSVLAVWFIKKNKKYYIIISALLVAFSMGLYQAYIGVTVGLCIIVPILELIKNEKDLEDILKEIFKCVFMVVIGLAIYYVITQISLMIYNTELASYKGANQIGLSSLKTIPQAIIQTYKSYYSFLFKDDILKNSYWKRQYFNMTFFIVTLFTGIILIIKNKIYKKRLNLIILILFVAVLPIGLNIINLIAQDASINLLMCESCFLPYIALIAAFEMLNINNFREICIKWIGIILCICLIITYIFTEQSTYILRQDIHERAYSTILRIVSKMESNEEYIENMKICFAGLVKIEPKNCYTYKMSMGFISEVGEFWDYYDTSRKAMKKFLLRYIGIDITWCSDKEYLEIINSEEFEEMSVFPKNGSTKVINGIMVVKLQKDPIEP